MKRTLLLSLCSLLVACQSPTTPSMARFAPSPQINSLQTLRAPLPRFQRMQTSDNYTEHETKHLHSHYPIEVGRRWMYDLELSKNGNAVESRMLNVYTQVLQPGLGGESRAILRRMYSNSGDAAPLTTVTQFTQHVELNHTGQTVREAFAADFATMNVENESNVKVTALRLPLTRGQQWEGRRFYGGVENVTVQGSERIAVPAGYFDTIKLQHCLQYNDGRKDYLFYWYVPGVGIVKFEEEINVHYQGRWQSFRAEGKLLNYVDPNKQKDQN